MARRTQSELNRQRFESVAIRTVSDIRHVLAQLEPNARFNAKTEDVTLTIKMTGTDIDSKSKPFKVSAKTKTNSARDVLIDGLNMIKQREDAAAKVSGERASIDVNGKEMKSPPVIAENSFASIDPVISRMLGGYREGHFVQWDLSDGYTYRYDIFAHKLTKFKKV